MHVWAVFYNKNNRLNTVSIFVYLNILLRPFFQLRSDLDFLAHQYGDTVSKVLIQNCKYTCVFQTVGSSL